MTRAALIIHIMSAFFIHREWFYVQNKLMKRNCIRNMQRFEYGFRCIDFSVRLSGATYKGYLSFLGRV